MYTYLQALHNASTNYKKIFTGFLSLRKSLQQQYFVIWIMLDIIDPQQFYLQIIVECSTETIKINIITWVHT